MYVFWHVFSLHLYMSRSVFPYIFLVDSVPHPSLSLFPTFVIDVRDSVLITASLPKTHCLLAQGRSLYFTPRETVIFGYLFDLADTDDDGLVGGADGGHAFLSRARLPPETLQRLWSEAGGGMLVQLFLCFQETPFVVFTHLQVTATRGQTHSWLGQWLSRCYIK